MTSNRESMLLGEELRLGYLISYINQELMKLCRASWPWMNVNSLFSPTPTHKARLPLRFLPPRPVCI